MTDDNGDGICGFAPQHNWPWAGGATPGRGRKGQPAALMARYFGSVSSQWE